jgi:20S proteasome subunit alpha 5
MEPGSIEKVLEIDEHIGCAMSGMTADARTMIDHARVVAQVWDVKISDALNLVILTKTWTLKNHTFTYDEKIKVESITQGVCDLALRFSDSATGEKASMVS